MLIQIDASDEDPSLIEMIESELHDLVDDLVGGGVPPIVIMAAMARTLQYTDREHSISPPVN